MGTIALKTAHGRYVVAERDGRLRADRTAVGDWEKFRPECKGKQKVTKKGHTKKVNLDRAILINCSIILFFSLLISLYGLTTYFL